MSQRRLAVALVGLLMMAACQDSHVTEPRIKAPEGPISPDIVVSAGTPATNFASGSMTTVATALYSAVGDAGPATAGTAPASDERNGVFSVEDDLFPGSTAVAYASEANKSQQSVRFDAQFTVPDDAVGARVVMNYAFVGASLDVRINGVSVASQGSGDGSAAFHLVCCNQPGTLQAGTNTLTFVIPTASVLFGAQIESGLEYSGAVVSLTADAASVSVDEGGTASNSGHYALPAGAVALAIPAAGESTIGNLVQHADGTWTWTGPAPAGPSSYSVSVEVFSVFSHAPIAEGDAFPIATFTVNVANVKPVVQLATAQTITVGQPYQSSGSFTDPGKDTWNATVDYGDGSGPQALALNSDKTFALSHLYSEGGNYDVQVCVNDGNDTGCASQSATVLRDNTPPVLTPTITGTLGQNGWYTSNVGVSWTVVDNESAITQQSCAAASVTTDTPGATFICTATSGGGTATQTVTIKRDASAPTLAFSGATSYTVDQTVAITCTASDPTSGVTTPCAGTSGNAYSFALGDNAFTTSATNGAGLTAQATQSFTVALTTDAMYPLITRFVSGKSLKTLTNRMDNIADKVGKQNPAVDAQVKNFLKELDDAQQAGDVSAANAAVLSRLVQLF